jgi:hypothetical protein
MLGTSLARSHTWLREEFLFYNMQTMQFFIEHNMEQAKNMKLAKSMKLILAAFEKLSGLKDKLS